MRRVSRIAVVLIAGLTAALPVSSQTAKEREELLKVRESVWRTFFEGDVKTLEKLVPPGTITINSGDENWEGQAEVLRDSAQFKTSGAKLIRLEFPRTEVQWFGDVAVTYSSYLYETEQDGKHTIKSGRVTEIFVRRNGQWTNPGWHTDSGTK